MEDALMKYLEENCQYILTQMSDMTHFDFSVKLSTSLISKKLCDKLYTVKQVCIEPETCNSVLNIEKRRIFAEERLKEERKGSFIVYYDVTTTTSIASGL